MYWYRMECSGGGRKRGRPITLTPDQKLEREQERWRKKKARKRKVVADAKGQRGTQSGYFERLWVPHYEELTKVLVAAGHLHKYDIHIAPRVDAAADNFFEHNPSGERWSSVYTGDAGGSRRLSRSGPGTVRIRMTADLADRLVEETCREEF